MARRRQKRVLVALGWYDYRLHRGIEKFAQEHDWHLSANLTREKIIPWGWEGDGILAWLGAGDDLAEFVVHAQRPTVDFSFRRPELRFPRVLQDHAHAARLAAEHFLARGFRHFLFYSDMDNWSYEERGDGFVEVLKQAGYECPWLRWHQSPAYRTDREQWNHKRKWLISQLKPAPKPLAVFTANDEHAVEILETCESAGLNVPEQVAIVGAENYLLSPNTMRTPVSSIDTNLETLGYTGAALLEDLMNGKKPPRRPVRVPPAGVIIRKSSDLLAVAHKGVANSLRFIWEHAHEPINVNNLVGAAAMSRRGLHQAFLDYVGRTPGQELQRVRIERAKRLLAENDYKLGVVSNLCGYRNTNSFCVAFKQATGTSPKQFRDKMAH